MRFGHFLYRQKSRWKYHTAKNETEKRIAEINQYSSVVESKGDRYYIREASLNIPKGLIDPIFTRFDLFLTNMRNLGGRYVWEDGRLFFLFDNYKFRIISSNELFIINEVFFNRCYNVNIPGDQIYNVIDIGMNVGFASLFFAAKKRVNQVFAFEPFPESFEHANNNLNANPHLSTKIKSFNFGLGKGERFQKMYFNPLASGNSGMKYCVKGAANTEERTVLIKDAFEVISEIIRAEPNIPVVVKMDCEGAEFEIMESLFEKGFSNEVKAVLMEWHGAIPMDFEQKFLDMGFQTLFTRLKNNLGLMYAFR